MLMTVSLVILDWIEGEEQSRFPEFSLPPFHQNHLEEFLLPDQGDKLSLLGIFFGVLVSEAFLNFLE